VEQDLPTLPEHLTSPPVFRGVRVTLCFVDRCLSFCTFSFGHCVVCSSSIYGFWLPLWYLQTLLTLIKYWTCSLDLIFTKRINNSSILIIIFHETIWIFHWRMHMLATPQYQPRLSSITNVDPDGSSNQIAVFTSN
jgi:hypothetical protein